MGSGEGTKSYEDNLLTNEIFGESNMAVVIVPNKSIVTEGKLADKLEELPFVKSVTSLAGTLPPGIPEDFLPENLTSQLHEGGYARLVVIVKSDSESDYAYSCMEQIKACLLYTSITQEQLNIIVLNGQPYLYRHGVYRRDEDGKILKAHIKALIHPDLITISRINRVYNLILADYRISKRNEEINKYPVHWINFKNGMYDPVARLMNCLLYTSRCV